MDDSREITSSKSRWVARQPLLFGLAAAGGVGLYTVVQMAGQPQDDDKAGKLANPPRQDLAEPAPAPDFGPVIAAAAEARIGGVGVSRIKPVYPAKVLLAAVPVRRASAIGRQPVDLQLPPVSSVAVMTRTHSALRHTGSFAVPSRSEADFASSAGLAMSHVTGETTQSAALSAPQPLLQAAAITAPSLAAMAAQTDVLVEAQATPRSFTPQDQAATTAMIVAQPESGLQQSAARSLLPEVPSATLTSPATSGDVASEPNAVPPIVRAGNAALRPVAASRMVPSQPRAAQPGATARVAAVKPAQGAESSLTLAPPAGQSGIEGLAGLDDSRLAAIRPILGETRQQAASAKRRGSAAGVARPSARRQTVEEATPNPGKISAAGSGLDMHVPARINGSPMGNLPVQIAADGAISLRLGDLLSLVEGQMDGQLFRSLHASSAAESNVSLATLRAAGMDMRYAAAANQIVLEVSQA